jgi:hypothetical protein
VCGWGVGRWLAAGLQGKQVGPRAAALWVVARTPAACTLTAHTPTWRHGAFPCGPHGESLPRPGVCVRPRIIMFHRL